MNDRDVEGLREGVRDGSATPCRRGRARRARPATRARRVGVRVGARVGAAPLGDAVRARVEHVAASPPRRVHHLGDDAHEARAAPRGRHVVERDGVEAVAPLAQVREQRIEARRRRRARSRRRARARARRAPPPSPARPRRHGRVGGRAGGVARVVARVEARERARRRRSPRAARARAEQRVGLAQVDERHEDRVRARAAPPGAAAGARRGRRTAASCASASRPRRGPAATSATSASSSGQARRAARARPPGHISDGRMHRRMWIRPPPVGRNSRNCPELTRVSIVSRIDERDDQARAPAASGRRVARRAEARRATVRMAADDASASEGRRARRAGSARARQARRARSRSAARRRGARAAAARGARGRDRRGRRRKYPQQRSRASKAARARRRHHGRQLGVGWRPPIPSPRPPRRVRVPTASARTARRAPRAGAGRGHRGGGAAASPHRAGGDATGEVCDLADLASVRAFARRLRARYPKGVGTLALNAGLAMSTADKAPRRTADGFDVQMQVNHLAHFLLTKLLMPPLARAAEARGEARVVATGGPVRPDERRRERRLEGDAGALEGLRRDGNAFAMVDGGAYDPDKATGTEAVQPALRRRGAERYANAQVTVNAFSPGLIADPKASSATRTRSSPRRSTRPRATPPRSPSRTSSAAPRSRTSPSTPRSRARAGAGTTRTRRARTSSPCTRRRPRRKTRPRRPLSQPTARGVTPGPGNRRGSRPRVGAIQDMLPRERGVARRRLAQVIRSRSRRRGAITAKGTGASFTRSGRAWADRARAVL